jgi:DNA-binding winged helix-turn-helix (wHTH) protein
MRQSGEDMALEFERFRVLPRQRQLLADGEPIKLRTRAFDLLLVLAEAGGLPVSKEELLSRVWPDVFVEENNLHVQISALRKALGNDRDLIGTDFGRGYRLTAVVRPAGTSSRPTSVTATASAPVEGGDRLVDALNRIASLIATGDTSKAPLGVEIVVRLLPANHAANGP